MARAFKGLTLVKEAQAAELRPAFQRHLSPEQLGWLDELVPTSIGWSENRRVHLTYSEEISEEGEAPGGPEAQVKLNDCWHLTAHPRVGEGAIPVKLWLQLPDGKRLEPTTDFLRWKVSDYPRHRSGLRAKYPGFVWP
jgi:ATP-dependent helicase HrpB